MISKGLRIAAYVNSTEFKAKKTSTFLVFQGMADALLPAVASKHNGCISGTGV